MIEALAAHVDFLCKDRQDMVAHLLRVVPMYSEIVDAYTQITSDDDMTEL